ncbi:MAG: hypothetical protein ACYC09_05155 [Bacteroidota bacterium]
MVTLTCITALAGCEDPLPVYAVPDTIFEARFVSLTPDSLVIRDDGTGTNSRYPVMTIVYAVKNVYEETIQLKIDVTGSIEIWLPTRPDLNSTVALSNINITPTAAIDYDTDILTLNPGASIYIQAVINPKLSSGFYLHRYTSIRYRESRYSEWMYYFYYEPMKVAHRLNIQLERTTTGISSAGESILVITGMEPMPR